MSRRTVDNEEILLPYKWKIDEQLQTPIAALRAPPPSDKSTYEYWRHEAYDYYNIGKFNEAIKFFDKSLEIKPNLGACLGKASAFKELGKHDQAIKCYDDYLEKQQHKTMKLLKRVGTLLRQSRKAAEKWYEVAPEKWYEVAEVWWYKGSLLTNLHRYAEAIQSYEKSEKLGFDSQLDIAGVFGQMGKYSEVIKRSEEVIRLEDIRYPPDQGHLPSHRKIAAMFFKANALDALGNFDEAIKCYDQVITIQQVSSDTLYYRGRSKVKNGDIMGGLSDLKAAVELDDKYQKLANSDKDFESIRNDPVFRSIVTKP